MDPTSGPLDVSIIVVSYNTCELTLRCLRSVAEETQRVDFEVIVVDNASQDGSVEEIRRQHPDARLIELSENVGFGRAVNYASARARGRYLLLLNPDAVVIGGAIDHMVSLADERPTAGLYGGVTLDEDDAPNHISCWRRPTPWSAFCQGIGLSALFPSSRWLSPQTCRVDLETTVQEVDVISGGLLLIARAWWDRLGGFDEDFFLYGEDFDLSLRARSSGARPCVFPAVRVVHAGGGTEQLQADRLVRLLRAKAMLYERHWSRLGVWIGRFSLVLWVLTRRIGYRLTRGASSGAARNWDEIWRRRRSFLRTAGGSPPPPIRQRTAGG